MASGGERYGYLWAVAAGAATTALAVPLRGTLAEANLLLFYLLAVVLVTVRFGRRPGILASVVAVLAFDVFMVPPYLSFSVADSEYLLTLGVMLLVSLLVSHLTANLRHQAQIARQREQHAQALFALSRELSGALGLEQIGAVGVRRLGAAFQARVALLLPDPHGRLAPLACGAPQALPLSDAMLVIARTVFEPGEAASHGQAAQSAGAYYLALRAPMGMRGVLVLAPAAQLQQGEQERLLHTCAAQVALAIERVHYVGAAQRALLETESERFRNSLLSAVSHDIRTPLTAIVALSGTLAGRHGGAQERELALAIHSAALRMDRLVSNLLDMARLQSGQVRLNRQWQTLEEIVGSALSQCGAALEGAALTVSLAPTLPLLEVDAVLLERVLCNLFDNIARHAGPAPAATLGARVDGAMLEVTVEDQGPGIDSALLATVFDKTTRGGQHGSGLGLAICKAIVQAHGGAITAANRAGGGARFTFTLPLGSPPNAEVD